MRGSLVVVAAFVAHANASPAGSATAGSARTTNDLVARPIVLDREQIAADLVVEINLAPKRFGDPTSLAPDVWFGATPRLTIGIVHSNHSVDRFSPGASVCVREGAECDSAYHGSGVDVRFSALAGDFALAPRARVLMRSLDPMKPAVTLGALVRWTGGRFAVTGDPYLQLGVANTDRGNRHALVLPVKLSVQPLARWELALRTGWHSDLAVVRDGWHVPIAVLSRVAISDDFDVTAMLGFASLLGPQNTAKERALFLIAAWRTAVVER